jgi:hypothetical protein
MSEYDPTHVLDRIETYLAGGLPPDERAAFEAHVAGCAACGGALAEGRRQDATLNELFEGVRPPAGFEGRMVRNLRLAEAPRRWWIHPRVLRSATGIAAAVLLAGTGWVVSSDLQHEGNPLWRLLVADSRVKVASNLRQIGQAIAMYSGWQGNAFPRQYWTAQGTAQAQPSAEPSSRNSADKLSLTPAADSYAYDQTTHTHDRFDSIHLPSARSFKPTEQLAAQSRGLDDRMKDANGKPFSAHERGVAGAPARAQANEGKLEEHQGKPAAATDSALPSSAGPLSDSAPAPIGRKIIRNGTMEFEVDRFDDAVMRVTKLVDEQQGFVATTDSDKLPNGHMKGTLTLRLPPERLDTLVLTLRGIGDLKSQKISAEDVTKHYTDLDSQLRAARAMEERLLGLIKSGTGQIKDLLAAEKELGVWREKIEAIEGEKRYLDNQVSLSTLVVSLFEKDIHTPASATDIEQVQMSLETDAVNDAYNKAIEAVRGAKGRITQSELKQYDAGQLGATIVAAIPPDAAEPVIARLRQLDGRIAHFARDRHQTTKDGTPAPAAVTQVQREDTIVSLQIYNLANIAPRRTMMLQVAANAVDRTYAQAIEQVRSAGGRIVTSSLTKPDPNTQVADLEAQVPADKADAVLDALRGYGEVMRQELSENPDTANVTEAKRGIHLRLVSLAAVPARETQTLQLAAANVPTAFNDILNAAKSADARVDQSDLSEQNPREITAAITIEVPRSAEASVQAAIGKASQVLTRTIKRSTDLEKTVDSKVRLTLMLISADRMPPRETTTEQVQVQDVGRATDDLVAAATSAGGRQIGTGGSEQSDTQHDTSHIVVEVPLNKAGPILDQLDRAGARRSKQASFDSSVPEGPLARARIDVTFSNSVTSLGGEETTWDALRNGLAFSGRGLRWSLQLLVIGFCFVAPWVLVPWLIWRVIRRSRSRSLTTPPAAT